MTATDAESRKWRKRCWPYCRPYRSSV